MNRIKKDANYMNRLVEYIKKNLRKGYTKESLKWALVSQGHSRLEIDKAVEIAQQEFAREAPVLKTKPEIKVEQVKPTMPELEAKKPFWKKLFG
jgi:SOS response regulatory protein OraA/RecX